MDRSFKIMLYATSALLCVLCTPKKALAQKNLPDGQGKVEFVHNCTACHRADMVTRVKKTPDEWRKSVDEMASRGTDGSKEDLDNAYLYLVKNYSKDGSDAAPTAQPATVSGPPSGSSLLKFSDLARYFVSFPAVRDAASLSNTNSVAMRR
jgi:hypothetical protein